MESILLSLALVACPVGMGLMMWLMVKGMGQGPGGRRPQADASVEELRDEHRRLGAEIERLEDQQGATVGGRQ